jgi:hypothetical protein
MGPDPKGCEQEHHQTRPAAVCPLPCWQALPQAKIALIAFRIKLPHLLMLAV